MFDDIFGVVCIKRSSSSRDRVNHRGCRTRKLPVKQTNIVILVLVAFLSIVRERDMI